MPSEPGVYWFSDADKNILYVGKAKDLKKRLASYQRLPQLSHRIHQMVTTAYHLDWHVLPSELEALLVEAELIRTHQPPFNILLKDDKSPLYILITQETFPRVLTRRKKELAVKPHKGTVLGPFPSAYKVKEVLKLVRPIFPWCNQASVPHSSHTQTTPRACFYYHLQLCPGACIHQISPEEYRRTIDHLVLFLRGKSRQVLTQLRSELKHAVASQRFEDAAQLRDTIELITSVIDSKQKLKPDFQLPHLQATVAQEQLVQLRKLLADFLPIPAEYPLERIEGYDVSNTSGTNPTVAQVTFTQGQADPAEYRLYNIKSLNTPNDFAMLKEALSRRQNHPEWTTPNLVVIDGGKGQLRAALSVWNWKVPVISIAKHPDRLIIPLSQNPPRYHIAELTADHPALKLVQQIRDEAHRFSKQQHTKMRQKSLLGQVVPRTRKV